MKRPILVALLGYIIGILWGYTLKISIVFFWLFFFLIFFMQKRWHYTWKRLFTFFFNKKVILLLVISSCLSNTILYFQNKKYDNLYTNVKETYLVGTVISEKEETEYNEVYKVKVEILNQEKKYKNTNLLLYIKKNKAIPIEYGDRIKVKGEYKSPEISRNFKGFNYKEYCKSEKVYGMIYAETVEILEKKKEKGIMFLANKIKNTLKEKINQVFDKELGGLLIGILVGDISQISEETIEEFRDSNLYHLLAVSGAHAGYITVGVFFLFEKIHVSKNITKGISILALVFFMFLTGFTPSVVRACLMAILVQVAFLCHRKVDTINILCFSLLCILIENPFKIQNLGLQLSYLRNDRDSHFLSQNKRKSSSFFSKKIFLFYLKKKL